MQQDAPVGAGLATRVPMAAKAVYKLLRRLVARSSAGLENCWLICVRVKYPVRYDERVWICLTAGKLGS